MDTVHRDTKEPVLFGGKVNLENFSKMQQGGLRQFLKMISRAVIKNAKPEVRHMVEIKEVRFKMLCDLQCHSNLPDQPASSGRCFELHFARRSEKITQMILLCYRSMVDTDASTTCGRAALQQ